MKLGRWGIALLAFALAIPAWAESSTQRKGTHTPQKALSGMSWQGWGVRLGVTDSADQVVAGAHFNLGEVVSNWRFQPDIELGSGDDTKALIGTAPLYYQFQMGTRMTPYAGGGLAVGYFDPDEELVALGADSEFGIGARATGGLEWSSRTGGAFCIELSVGFGDIHDLQMVGAWSF